MGGTAGAALFARSREVAPAAPVASQYVARQKITLASGSLRKSLPIDEEVELDDAPESDPLESASLKSEPAEPASSEPEPPKAVPPKSAPSESAWNFLFARRSRPRTD